MISRPLSLNSASRQSSLLRSDDVDAEDKLLVERAGMTYVRIPMTTHKAVMSHSWIDGRRRTICGP
jgi:hypothetical protein